MEAVTADLPRTEVVALWREALEVALRRLQERKGLPVLSCHLTFYSYRSNEFYSPLAIGGFPEDFRPNSILVLLDDIYDMFERLRTPGQVYAVHETRHFQRVEKSDDLSLAARGEDPAAVGEDGQRQETLANQLRLEARVTALLRLLAWRRADIVVGELLAAQWPASRVAYVGTKQLQNVVGRWLNEEIPVTYLSHPISRPRKDLRKLREADPGAGWDQVPVVGQFNELQFQLATRDIFAIMPTAIDEYRLEREPGVLLGRRPRLDARWPIPYEGDSLYDAPSDEAPEYTSLLEVGPVIDVGSASGMLRALEMTIREEIAFRVHLLVEATQHLTVFRPLHGTGDFSDGVRIEIEHWESLALTDETKRAVLVHFDEDVGALKSSLEAAGDVDLKGDIENLVNQAAQESGVARPAAATKPSDLDSGGGGGAEDERKRAQERWDELQEQARPAAARTELWKRLTRVKNPQRLEKQVALFIVPDSQAWEQLYPVVGLFLKDGDPRGIPSWEEAVERAAAGWLAQLATG